MKHGQYQDQDQDQDQIPNTPLHMKQYNNTTTIQQYNNNYTKTPQNIPKHI